MASPLPPASTELAANLASVRGRIARAAERAGRDPAGITLIAVSKTFAAGHVAAAVAAGVRDLGENRIQEAAIKRPEVEHILGADQPGSSLRWHLIGHLQTNKVKQALATFDLIHSVDSLHLAEALSRHATRCVEVLVEVNAGGEESKFGFTPAETPAAVAQIAGMHHLHVSGLMTVAPATADPETVRPLFRDLRLLRDALGLSHLSMGMSGDYEVAVEEGATMVRVGRAIFGERA